MRHKVFVRGGYNTKNISIAGGEANGPVFLTKDPTLANEAATKQYVDAVASTLDATSFVSGILSADRLPAFTGAITKPEGSSIVSISPTGVATGNYTKITVNIKGQVIAGTVLSESDMPALSWSKFSSTAPTTLAGYGITDALPNVSPVMTGFLKVNTDGINESDLINKRQVDETLVGRYKVGEVEYKLTKNTPVGYLRCNGGELSKTMYSELYSVIGDSFGSVEFVQQNPAKFCLPTITSALVGATPYIKY